MASNDKAVVTVEKHEEVQEQKKKVGGLLGALYWYLEWGLPGLGMYSEAYIIFSAGQIKQFQKTMWPSCYSKFIDCDAEMVNHLAGYIQICGIMAGMLLWGVLADFTGRKWGSRIVAFIMLSGCIMLVFTPWANTAYGYFSFFMVAQTWYGFGVGGEYPLASASAAERSAVNPELRHRRGEQVILVFSNQGMGNLTNACVILICMAIFGQTGTAAEMDFEGSKHVLALSYGYGAIACLAMVLYRSIYLEESKMFEEETEIEHTVLEKHHVKQAVLKKHYLSFLRYWPRQVAASVAWVCNDFAFYGNKLQQDVFLTILFPGATPYKKQQWNVLNSFISLLGYYLAAGLVDKRWYGRVKMQNVGFGAMFVFNIIIYGAWSKMGDPATSNPSGARAMQALYYLSSFFNQFGPNATTWLVAGECFPTDIRASYHGFAACMGKLGAIIASLWISYVSDKRKVFLLAALWSIGGYVVTLIFQNDTTGLELEEYDRLQRCNLEGRWDDYHGEAINPRYLSLWEKYVLRWHKNYDPEMDRQQLAVEMKEMDEFPAGHEQMHRMQHVHEMEEEATKIKA